MELDVAVLVAVLLSELVDVSELVAVLLLVALPVSEDVDVPDDVAGHTCTHTHHTTTHHIPHTTHTRRIMTLPTPQPRCSALVACISRSMWRTATSLPPPPPPAP